MKYYCHWVCKYSYFNHNPPPTPADVCVCKGGRLRYGLRENWKGRNRGGRDGTGGRGELEKRKRKGRAGTKGRRWLGAGWRSWGENEWTDIPCCTIPSCLQMPRLKKKRKAAQSQNVFSAHLNCWGVGRRPVGHSCSGSGLRGSPPPPMPTFRRYKNREPQLPMLFPGDSSSLREQGGGARGFK